MKEFDNEHIEDLSEYREDLFEYWTNYFAKNNIIANWDRILMGGSEGIHKSTADNSLRSK